MPSRIRIALFATLFVLNAAVPSLASQGPGVRPAAQVQPSDPVATSSPTAAARDAMTPHAFARVLIDLERPRQCGLLTALTDGSDWTIARLPSPTGGVSALTPIAVPPACPETRRSTIFGETFGGVTARKAGTIAMCGTR